MKQYELLFKVGATVGSSFTGSFKTTESTMKQLKGTLNELKTQLKDVEGFEKQKKSLDTNKQKLEALQKEYQQLQTELKNTNAPNTEFTNKMSKTESQIKQTTEKINTQEAALSALSSELKNSGVNTENLAAEQARLQDEYKKYTSLKTDIDGISTAQAQNKQEIQQTTSELAKLTAGYAAVVAVAYKAAIQPAIEFESAFTGVTKTVDGTDEQLAELRTDILAMSTEMPSSAVEIAAVAEAAGQLGIETENIADFTEVMVDLGESTNLSATEAASDLAKFANVTKMSADNYDELGSVIVDLGNNMATTEADIVAMGTRLASTGELTGLSESQIMAFSAALSSLGIEAEAGGTAAAKMLKKMSLADAKGDMEKYATVAGMTGSQFQKLFEKDALAALSAFTGGLNDTERNGQNALQILDDMDISEVRLSNAILSLASSEGVLDEAVDIANTAWEENTALTEEAGKRYATTESKIEMAKNSLTTAGIAVGEVFTPMVAEGAEKISKMAQEFAQWAKENPETIKQVASIVAQLAALKLGSVGVKLVFKELKGVGLGVAKTFKIAQTGIVKMFGASTAAAGVASAGILAVAAAVAVVGVALYKQHEAWKAARKEYADGFIFNNGGKKLSDYTTALKEATTQDYAFAQSITSTTDELESIQSEIISAKNEVQAYGEAIFNDATLSESDAEALKEPFNSLADALETDFTVRYDAVFEAFKLAAGDVATSLGVDVATISSTLDSFKNKYTGSIDNAQAAVNAALDKRAAGETLTPEEAAQLKSDLEFTYKMQSSESETKAAYNAQLEKIGGMDLGADQAAAVENITELQTYAQSYLDELDAAQEQLNQNSEVMRTQAGYMLEHGDYTQAEYDATIESLNVAQGVTYEAYKENRDKFVEEMQSAVSGIWGQINIAKSAYTDAEPDDWTKGSSWWEWQYNDILANFGLGGRTDQDYSDFEASINNKMQAAADEAYNDVTTSAANFSVAMDTAAADIVNLPDEIAAAWGSYKAQNARQIVIGSQAQADYYKGYAGGTANSVSNYIAGENGAELITNSPGRTVYTAAETADIINGYKQMIMFLPQMQRAAVNADYGAGNAGGVSVKIENNFNGGVSTNVSGSDDDALAEKIINVVENHYNDLSRRAYQ